MSKRFIENATPEDFANFAKHKREKDRKRYEARHVMMDATRLQEAIQGWNDEPFKRLMEKVLFSDSNVVKVDRFDINAVCNRLMAISREWEKADLLRHIDALEKRVTTLEGLLEKATLVINRTHKSDCPAFKNLTPTTWKQCTCGYREILLDYTKAANAALSQGEERK